MATTNPQETAADDAPTSAIVTLRSTYEIDDPEAAALPDAELAERAREAFYLDGAEVSADVERDPDCRVTAPVPRRSLATLADHIAEELANGRYEGQYRDELEQAVEDVFEALQQEGDR